MNIKGSSRKLLLESSRYLHDRLFAFYLPPVFLARGTLLDLTFYSNAKHLSIRVQQSTVSITYSQEGSFPLPSRILFDDVDAGWLGRNSIEDIKMGIKESSKPSSNSGHDSVLL